MESISLKFLMRHQHQPHPPRGQQQQQINQQPSNLNNNHQTKKQLDLENDRALKVHLHLHLLLGNVKNQMQNQRNHYQQLDLVLGNESVGKRIKKLYIRWKTKSLFIYKLHQKDHMHHHQHYYPRLQPIQTKATNQLGSSQDLNSNFITIFFAKNTSTTHAIHQLNIEISLFQVSRCAFFKGWNVTLTMK